MGMLLSRNGKYVGYASDENRIMEYGVTGERLPIDDPKIVAFMNPPEAPRRDLEAEIDQLQADIAELKLR